MKNNLCKNKNYNYQKYISNKNHKTLWDGTTQVGIGIILQTIFHIITNHECKYVKNSKIRKNFRRTKEVKYETKTTKIARKKTTKMNESKVNETIPDSFTTSTPNISTLFEIQIPLVENGNKKKKKKVVINELGESYIVKSDQSKRRRDSDILEISVDIDGAPTNRLETIEHIDNSPRAAPNLKKYQQKWP